MSSIEMAVRNARAIETLLVERLGASGKGLHEKLNSVEQRLPVHIVKTARWIATLRNSAVHQHDFEIANPEDFMNAAARVLAHLESMPKSAAAAAPQVRQATTADGLQLETLRQSGGPQRERPAVAAATGSSPSHSTRRRHRSKARSSGQGWWLGFVLVAGGLLVAVLYKTGALRPVIGQ